MLGRISWATICALLLSAMFVAAILTTINFPLGTLGDEWAKIDAVLTGNNRYYHPLLMIEVAQFANLFAGARDLQAVVEVGRACAAFAGGLLVFATYWLGRLVLPELAALAAAAATAATPIVTVHARIMKEDIFVAPFLILGLAALIKLLQDPTPLRTVLTGVYAGLAGGAKYIGTLFLPFALAAIMLVPGPRAERRLSRVLTVAGVAILVFALIELPALRKLALLRRGIYYEFTHATHGHDVPLPVSLTYGGLHLTESLWPGLGLTLLVLGLLGLAAPFLAPPERRMPLGLIAGFTLLWYAVHELVPLKPYPDVTRYMLPLAPLLCILAASFFYELLKRRDARAIIAAAIVTAAAIPALVTSVRINGGGQDPRAVVPQVLAATGLRIATDRYADYDASRDFIGEPWHRPTAETADIAVTANLVYDRFGSYAARKDWVSRPTAGYYRRLNALPHLDVSNRRPTLGYFNPVLRIVALDGNIARLEQISAAITAAAPEFKVRLIDRKPKT
jgi:4-amino-4-deoxy-L-arabinose transferase-like glycosyltransferase